MTSIDFTQPIIDAYGDSVMVAVDTPLTLGRACYMALSRVLPGEERDRDIEAKWHALAIKIVKAEKTKTPLSLSAQEITWTNSRVGVVFTDLNVTEGVPEMLEPGKEAG